MHLTEKQIDGYTNRTLSAAELLRLDDHLTACAVCREQLAQVMSAQAGVAQVVNAMVGELTATAEFHLSFAALAAGVDGQLAEVDQEIVARHLQRCPACQAEFDDLHAFRQMLSAADATTTLLSLTLPDERRDILKKLWQLPVP